MRFTKATSYYSGQIFKNFFAYAYAYAYMQTQKKCICILHIFICKQISNIAYFVCILHISQKFSKTIYFVEFQHCRQHSKVTHYILIACHVNNHNITSRIVHFSLAWYFMNYREMIPYLEYHIGIYQLRYLHGISFKWNDSIKNQIPSIDHSYIQMGHFSSKS